jgi:hypothetical protein
MATRLATMVLILAATLWSAFSFGPAKAGEPLDAAQIKAVLKTAQPEENGFVERVVAKANEGKLPGKLIEKAVLWARQKPKHRFQYFKAALIEMASRAGYSI